MTTDEAKWRFLEMTMEYGNAGAFAFLYLLAVDPIEIEQRDAALDVPTKEKKNVD